MSKFKDSVNVSVSDYFKYTLACVELLRGIIAKRDPQDILVNTPAIKEYLENFRGRKQDMALQQLAALCVEFKDHDDATCIAAIHDVIDSFTLDSRRISNDYIQFDFARLIAYLAKRYKCEDVFEPFAGKASFAQLLPEHTSYLGQEMNSYLYQLAKLRLEFLEGENFTVMQGNSFYPFPERDMIVSEVPWGVRNSEVSDHTTSEYFFLRESARSARKISLGIYPYGVLFRVGSTEKEIRKNLIENDLVEYVIKLPARLYAPQTNVQTCIVITNRDKARKGFVRFIDASNCIVPDKAYTRLDVDHLIQILQTPELKSREYLWVSNDEILGNNAVLAMEEYLPINIEKPEGYDLVALKELLIPISGRKPTDATEIPLVRVSDLAVNPFDFSLGDELPKLQPYNSAYEFIPEPAVFISKFRPLKQTYFSAKCGGVYINPNIFAFRVKSDKVIPQFLLNELSKDYVQKQLFYAGTYVLRLTRRTFLDVKVLIPSLEEQNLTVMQIMQDAHERSKQSLTESKSSFDAEWRDRQHTLGHVAAEVTLAGHALDNLMRLQNGVLHDDDIVDTEKEESVREYFEKLIFNVDRMSFLIKHLTDKEKLGLKEQISLKEFFTAYKKQHVLPNFKLDISNIGSKYVVEFAKENWTTVVENIFSNIKKYAFPEATSVGNNLVVVLTEEIVFKDSPAVTILIMNNGAPLDESISPEMVFRWGKTSSKDDSGHGLGGNHVKKLVEFFNGEVTFLTQDDLPSGFTTAYRIVLPLINE